MYDVSNTRNTHSDGRYDDKHKDKIVKGLNKCGEVPREKTADCIGCHIDIVASVKLALGWYSYISTEDTFEPPNHITQHFATRNWRPVSGKRA